jgi:hypothetical protein
LLTAIVAAACSDDSPSNPRNDGAVDAAIRDTGTGRLDTSRADLPPADTAVVDTVTVDAPADAAPADAAPADAPADGAPADGAPADAAPDLPEADAHACSAPGSDAMLGDAGSFTGPTPAIYWSFEPATISGSSVSDGSGSGHTGTATGGVSFGAGGIVGEAAFFDGATGIITNDSLAKQTPVTIAVWLRPEAFTTGGSLIAVNQGNGASTWTGTGIGVREGARYFAEGGSGSAQEKTVETLSCLVPQQWVHIVGVMDGTDVAIYRDGVFQASEATGYSEIAYGTVGLVLGRHSYFLNRYYKGGIDELAIWHSALDSDQIAELHALGRAGIALLP